MAHLIRKQTHTDFRRRVKTVDPRFYRWGERGTVRDLTPQRPVGSALMGFGWAYLVISVSNNRDHIAASLKQGNLPAQYHDWIFAGLAVLLAVSGVMLALHVFRYLFKNGGKRKNSGGLLIGALGALVLIYTPSTVWTTGFGMLDSNSQGLMMQASATVGDVLPGVDFGKVTFVSSNGR
ncbi:hypothetical protein [Tropicibacter naphthalenivorans]|uniref:Uncharacterized protein n=1 Tax=Tropicibacter naphthalenivorans TaxID=441103 RepID=A0A0P1G7G8_9RHOB|nr:hypothetical protein [Tropicibacter naphthalenivorans]CUH77630.1 hypothetical protein TRN7648_01575 [Tropicibacter naphthalenivorans]SMC54873.1 hypothetical protein SAMN04488093_10242 [Tropicibacter naphthalenivorans]